MSHFFRLDNDISLANLRVVGCGKSVFVQPHISVQAFEMLVSIITAGPTG
jgi:hypothetical protein